MASHPFVLRSPSTTTAWPTAGDPVFALRIDGERLEYWDPTEQRGNDLRRLLIRAFVAEGKNSAEARKLADGRIDAAVSARSIDRWRHEIKDGIQPGAARRELDAFLKTITQTRQREDYRVDYAFVWLGISTSNLVHRRLRATYASAKILQAVTKIGGVATVKFPPSLCPVFAQKSFRTGRQIFAAGGILCWDAYDGVPVEYTGDMNWSRIFALGRIVAVSAASPRPALPRF